MDARLVSEVVFASVVELELAASMADIALLELIIFCSLLFVTIICDASLAFETASIFAALWDPVNANKLALKGLGSTTPLPPAPRPPTLDFDDKAFTAAADDVAAAVMVAEDAETDLTSLLEEYFIDVILRSSDIEAISDLAEASMLKAAAALGAVLGRCLHLCRLKEK